MGEIKVKTADSWLTLPSHEKTSTGWKDIPTHTMTATGWQGELTSQSPLKFRADGEMLDWRVEGRTSGNLFDVNGNIARESPDSIEISQDQIIITVAATWSRDYVIFDKIFEPGLYTIKIISSSDTSGASYTIGCLSTAPLIGWTYNDYYAAYVKNFDNTLIIKITDSTRIGFRCSSSQVGQKVTLSNIKLLEGAYIPEGDNLFDGEWKQGTIMSPSSQTRVSNKNVISLKPNTVYTIGLRGSSIIQYALVYRDKDGNVTYDSGWFSTESPVLSPISNGATAEILLRRSDAGSISPVSEEVLSLKVIFAEDTYPSSYEPYGGVGDWDETAQKYRIPVNVRGDNLYSSAWEQGFWSYDTGAGWGTDSKYVRTAKMSCKGNTKYEFVCSLPDGSKDYGFVFWDTNGNYIGNTHSSDVQNTPVKYSGTSPANAKMMAINIARYSDGERHPADILSFDLYELHETNLYTDHQLMDGDSLDYTTDQTSIPITQGDNTLTVGTAVQPSKVFVKFEG